MGADAGFDMVPRLGRSAEDIRKWKQFLETIQQLYKHDAKVKFGSHYIEFLAGEHPKLPIDGQKFLRYSAKVTGSIARETGVEKYIQTVL